MAGEGRKRELIVRCPQCGERFVAVEQGEDSCFSCPGCGSSFYDRDATHLDEPSEGAAVATSGGRWHGEVLGGCRIEEEIGHGGMGIVFRAKQLSLDRTVALKILPKALSRSPDFVERFHQESKAMSDLNHENIVTIIDRGNDEDTYYFVMEYVEGRRLDELIGEGLETEQVIDIAKQICSGLAYAHRRGLVHRDIKPKNIIVTSEHKVKIADFGLAGLVMGEETRAAMAGVGGVVMGTPAYMSPEQKQNPLNVDGRSDIFSLGVVMYEMIAGHRPHPVRMEPPSLANERADFRLDPIVFKCLQQDPSRRYQSAEELLADIVDLEKELANAPGCPHCGARNPVRFTQCERCGGTLEELFYECPECGHESRVDVRECPNCGLDLHTTRREQQAKLDEMFQHVLELKGEHNYREAVKVLERILEVKGKAFQKSRARAKEMLQTTRRQLRQAAERTFQEGRRLFAEQRFEEAIEAWESIPPEALDVSKTLEYARRKLKQMQAMRRPWDLINVLLVALALVIMAILVIQAIQRGGS